MEKYMLNKSKIYHTDELKHTEENSKIIAANLYRMKPEIVVFELPEENNKMFCYLNEDDVFHKSQKILKSMRKSLEKALGKFSYYFDAIEEIWEEGKNIYLAAFDAPLKITSYSTKLGKEESSYLYWIAYKFVRELYMAENLKKICKENEKSKVYLIVHNNHWKRIKIILEKSVEEVYDYYFHKFALECGVKKISKNELEKSLKGKHKLLLEEVRKFEIIE